MGSSLAPTRNVTSAAQISRVQVPAGVSYRSRRPLRPLENDGNPLAAADAGRRHAELLLPLLQLEQQRVDEARAGGAERVAKADRPAIHVHLLAIEAQLLLDRQVLPGERLVDLEQIELIELHAGALERLAYRGRG